jgi:tRNA G26 N,N-dimethylase Trm1
MNIYHKINNKHDRYQLIDLHTKHKMISILKCQLATEALNMHYHHINKKHMISIVNKTKAFSHLRSKGIQVN